jgi:nitrogen regulatory protein P-II 1
VFSEPPARERYGEWMKKLEAVIHGCKADAVREALKNEKIPRIAIFEVKGAGSSQGKLKQYRGAPYIEESADVKVEIVVDDDDAERIAHLIMGALRTGNLADGEVVILPAEQVMRCRVGERSASGSNRQRDTGPRCLQKKNFSMRTRLQALRKKLFESTS